MVFLNGTLLLGLISCCLAVPHRNVGRATTSLIPTSSLSAPTGTPTRAPKIDQKRYSNHVNDFYKLYGWLKPGTSVPDSDLPEAIRKIQAKLKEPVTGEFSEKMLAMMEGPRCGTEQQYVGTGTGEGQESKERYALWGPKWAKMTLTWRIDRYTNDLSQERQLSTIGSAFAQWMNSAPLNIVQAASNVKADINIRFLPINSNRTVAVTMIDSDGVYFTPGKINITFNDNEQWTDDILFSTTAVHEIGHALGLSHSTVPSAIMFAYYDGLMHPIHSDDKMGIHSIYGWKTPKWKLIDSGSKISSIIQVTSSSSTPAPNDGLYQMRPTGQILRYINNAWITIDNYKETAQITGANGLLYQRHYDGGTFRWTGTPSNWQSISPTDTSILDIHAASDQLYARRKDGSVVRLSGSTWLTIDQSSPGSRQIAVSDDKTLWNLLSNGDLVRSRWPYTSAAILDRNAANTGIAVGGNEFFKVQSDGAVVWLDIKGPYWSVIEQKASVGIHAVGELLYSRHADGTLWRWTGIPGVWEGIDERGGVGDVTGDRAGGVWGVLGGSEVWMHVS